MSTPPKNPAELIKRRWSTVEDAILREVWPTRISAVEIDMKLEGRTHSSICRRAFDLGLKRPVDLPHPGKVISPVFVRAGVAGKACVVCLEWKPLEKFSRHATCAGGRRNRCTTCEGRHAYAINPTSRIATARRYQARHPSKMRAIRRAAGARRRSREMQWGGVSTAEYDELMSIFGGMCVYCAASADTFDHVIPLARGGSHSFENLVPACAQCNRSKHAKTPEEWAESKRGRAQRAR